jgi:hypothetical protein
VPAARWLAGEPEEGVSYIGVSQSGKRWVATLTSARAGYHMALGAFDSPTEAAAAYDEVCVPVSLPSVQLYDAPLPSHSPVAFTRQCYLVQVSLVSLQPPPPAFTNQSLPS